MDALRRLTVSDLPIRRKKQSRIRNRGGVERIESMGGNTSGFPKGTSAEKGFKGTRTRMNKRDEFVTNILIPPTGGTNFTVVGNYNANPGLANLFPWLSRIAQNFDKFEFTKLHFKYKPMVSQYQQSGQAGKILFAFDYDASDSPPASKTQFENTTVHLDCMAYQAVTVPTEPRELHKNSNAKFVRGISIPSKTSILDFDCGVLYVGMEGIEGAPNSKLGELWVEYDGFFSVPVLEDVVPQFPVNNSYSLMRSKADPSRDIIYPYPANDREPLLVYGNALVPPGWDTNGLNIVAVVNTVGGNWTTFTPPAGNYMYIIDMTLIDNALGSQVENWYMGLCFGPGTSGPLGASPLQAFAQVQFDGTGATNLNLDEYSLYQTGVFSTDGTISLWVETVINYTTNPPTYKCGVVFIAI